MALSRHCVELAIYVSQVLTALFCANNVYSSTAGKIPVSLWSTFYLAPVGFVFGVSCVVITATVYWKKVAGKHLSHVHCNVGASAAHNTAALTRPSVCKAPLEFTSSMCWLAKPALQHCKDL